MLSRYRSCLLLAICCCYNVMVGQSTDSLFSALHQNLAKAAKTVELRIPLSKLSLYHLENRALDSTRYYAKRLLQHGISVGDQRALKNAYWFLGRANFFDTQYDQAASYFQKTLELSLNEQDTAAALQAANSLGLTMRRQGKIEGAIKMLQQALGWSIAKQDTFHQTIISINLGASYRTIGADEVGAKYYAQARSFAQVAQDSLSLGQISINQASYFSVKEQYDSSRHYYEEAERLFLALGNVDQLGLVYANLSHVDLQEKKYESALQYSQRVFEELDSLAVNRDALIVSLINTYEAYSGLGEYLKGASYLQRAEDLALAHNEVLFLNDIYYQQAALNEAHGDYEKAYDYLQKYLTFKDSLFNQSAIIDAVGRENESLLSQKERVIDNLEKSSEAQQVQYKTLRNWSIAAALILAALLIAFYIYSLKQKQENLLISQQAAENKLEALRNQINPHFLFNSFNAIQHYILKSDQQKAYNYLTEFAQLLRMILDNAPKMTIQFSEELSILKAYVNLEALRFQGKIHYEFILADNLLEDNPRVPSMIIQPYIENAILHGISNRENGGGILKVNFSRMENEDYSYLHCVIEDNGIGRKKAQQIKEENDKHRQHPSIAMNNTGRRLQILEKTGYRRSKVEIEDLYTNDQASGTRVVLELPFL